MSTAAQAAIQPARGGPRVRLPRAVPAAIAAAWALAVAAQATGHDAQLHHGALIEHGPAYPLALVLFVVAWQLMLAAMMLPSSLPMIRLFAATSARQARPRAALAGFLGGYGLVWTAFGTAAFCGDLVIHDAVDHTPWLSAHPWIIAGSTLTLAGAFQFTALKDRCLEQCRHPGAFLLRHYRSGAGGGFRLGQAHGRFCLGCCWALMLVMFGAGVANLWWMAALTALMTYEKTGPGGRRAVPVAGIALLAAGALTFLHPAWLPPLLGGDA
jgi:predicted metal-binding membrane protein